MAAARLSGDGMAWSGGPAQLLPGKVTGVFECVDDTSAAGNQNHIGPCAEELNDQGTVSGEVQ